MIFWNRLEKFNFDKTFENIIENEHAFHGYVTAKTEIQQQPDDIDVNPFMCELRQTLFHALVFNPALKVTNITLACKNDENNIDFGVVEKRDGLEMLMASAHKLSAPANKKVITDS